MCECLEILSDINDVARLEYQGYEFAGPFMVPQQLLVKRIRELLPAAAERALTKDSKIEIMANRLAKLFRVSPEVMRKRFEREHLLWLFT